MLLHICRNVILFGSLAILLWSCEADRSTPDKAKGLPLHVRKVVLRDLEQIRQDGVLRLATRNNETNYFLFKGSQMGFEFDILQKFAKKNGLLIEVVPSNSWEAMVELLDSGQVDVIGAGITPSLAREAVADFSIPYRETTQVAVFSEEVEKIERPEELFTHEIHVRDHSPALDAIRQLEIRFGKKADLTLLPETLEEAEVLQQVASGEINVTVADRSVAELETASTQGLRVGPAIGETKGTAFALRQNAPELKKALDAFLTRILRRKWYAIIERRYYADRGRLTRQRSHNQFTLSSGRLSRWDDLFRKYAERYDFDWRLIAALAWHESRFDPSSKSWAGAKGIMQIMPIAAKDLKMNCFASNEANIHCGVRFLSRLRSQFLHLGEEERIKFALAAFNAGAGHVRDARVLCLDYKLNPMIWENNVEQALLHLMSWHYYRQYRSGYCDGRQTVNYVNGILTLYRTYQQTVPLTPETEEEAVSEDGKGESDTNKPLTATR